MHTWELIHDGTAITGQRCRMPNIGDGLPMHDHTGRDTEHSVEVVTGSILVVGPHWRLSLKAGERDELIGKPRHEIIATAPGTEIVNVLHQPLVGPSIAPMSGEDDRPVTTLTTTP